MARWEAPRRAGVRNLGLVKVNPECFCQVSVVFLLAISCVPAGMRTGISAIRTRPAAGDLCPVMFLFGADIMRENFEQGDQVVS